MIPCVTSLDILLSLQQICIHMYILVPCKILNRTSYICLQKNKPCRTKFCENICLILNDFGIENKQNPFVNKV